MININYKNTNNLLLITRRRGRLTMNNRELSIREKKLLNDIKEGTLDLKRLKNLEIDRTGDENPTFPPIIYLAAVQKFGLSALKDVPEDFRTPDMYLEAVKKNWNALQIIPKEKCTRAMYLLAVTQNSAAFQYILPEECDYNLCLEGVKSCSSVSSLQNIFKYIKENKTNAELHSLYLEAVKNFPEFLSFIPEDELTYKICLKVRYV